MIDGPVAADLLASSVPVMNSATSSRPWIDSAALIMVGWRPSGRQARGRLSLGDTMRQQTLLDSTLGLCQRRVATRSAASAASPGPMHRPEIRYGVVSMEIGSPAASAVWLGRALLARRPMIAAKIASSV